MRKLFGKYGKIKQVVLLKQQRTGEPLGAGFVDYLNPLEDAVPTLRDY